MKLFLKKDFLELYNIQLIRQLSFLVEIEEDISKSIKELQDFLKKHNIYVLKNIEIYKIRGNIYKNHKDCKNTTKKIKINFNGFTLLKSIRGRYGAFLKFAIEADLIELIIMVYNNIKKTVVIFIKYIIT